MSHISRIKTKMVVKEYLLAALKDLGYKFEEGELQVSGFGHQQIPVEIKVPLRLSYDIGFRKSETGYEIVADWFGIRGVDKKNFNEQITQRYAYHATRAKLEAQGFTLVSEEVHEEGKEKGQIRLVLRRMA